MIDYLKSDPEGWTSNGGPNCWFRRKMTPADRKVATLTEQNRRLLDALSVMNERLTSLEMGKGHD